MDKISLTINDKPITGKVGMTVLEVAKEAGIYIPTLCYHPDLQSSKEVQTSESIYRRTERIGDDRSMSKPEGCQLCVVEIKGTGDLPTACTTKATEGMVVYTDTPQIHQKQRDNLRLILIRHPSLCLDCDRRQRCQPSDICLRSATVAERCVICPKNMHCELQEVTDYIGIDERPLPYTGTKYPIVDTETPLFDRDYNYCISCTRCVRVCRDVRGADALGYVFEDGKVVLGTRGPSLKESGCVFCGLCAEVCPVGAITDRNFRHEEHRVKLAPCQAACPVHMDVPRYVRLIKEGRYAESLAVIRETAPFPEVLGYVCVHFCETPCCRGELEKAIAIRDLKRLAAEQDTGLWKQRAKFTAPTGKRIAVIGSGPAGLTAAYYLTKQGHELTVFEALPVTGGMMRVGIPTYRLPAIVLEKEIKEIESVGVKIKTNSRVESLDELFEQGYQAIFISVGAHQGITMGIEGETTPGVIDGVDFLREVSLGKEVSVGNRVMVMGGGNVATDASQTALRLGAKEVTIVYRRTRAEMPAGEEEVEEALEEGIKLEYLMTPTKITNKHGKLRVEFIRMILGKVDESGRRRPVPVTGSEFTKEYDLVIKATGQEPVVPDKFGLKLEKGKRIKVAPETMATARKGVYAGGDVVSGPASVIEAIAAGRKAASSIDKYLGGNGEIEETLIEVEKTNPYLGRQEDFADKPRLPMPCLPVEERTNNFTRVKFGYSKTEGTSEAERCLQCDLRCGLSPVPLPLKKRLESKPKVLVPSRQRASV
ncbi:MAG: FAD-dependent oxidoreductase [Dehalococcoidales bacterium]|nr:FAD-dependent oxidoreductase [Dehalococcoidales bacterium]MDP6737833.1 FAD-dependent oxidoreductase [Dehalococcoidales bacterium]